jgi:hypothetical protein
VLLEVPDDFTDLASCTETPKTCETELHGDYTMEHTGATDVWENEVGTSTIDNCHCVGSDFIERTITITEECVTNDDGSESCIVTVSIHLAETNTCDPPGIGGATHEWIYKTLGPIDIRSSNKFEVPFYDEIVTDAAVCFEGDYPDSVFIKEVP